MNLTHLKYAIEVEKTGSITKAAENLYMGQPNLSRVIKELEDEEEGFDRSQSEESEGERAALPTDGKEADADDVEEEEAGDDFDTDDDVFDFDDVPSFEDISLDDLDDK